VSTIDTSYTVLKYRHDAGVGEVLNFGVVLYSPETGQVGARVSSRYARLSEAFAGFDGEIYREVTGRLTAALDRIGSQLTQGLYQLEERQKYRDAGSLIRSVWPDQGMAYIAGPNLFGTTDDFERELGDLYERFVLSQHDAGSSTARLDDEALWGSIRRVLSPRGITAVLRPKLLGSADVEFDHAYQNKNWHVIEPVSLDYLNGADIKHRALLTVGKAAAVREVEELGSLTVVVARPRRIEAEKPLRDALQLLRGILRQVPGRIVEEDELERFAEELEEEMRAHGVLPLSGDASEVSAIR